MWLLRTPVETVRSSDLEDRSTRPAGFDSVGIAPFSEVEARSVRRIEPVKIIQANAAPGGH